MTHEQIEYRKYIMQGMASYGGDVAQALVWCGNHYHELPDTKHVSIQRLSSKERNAVIHELTMASVVTG